MIATTRPSRVCDSDVEIEVGTQYALKKVKGHITVSDRGVIEICYSKGDGTSTVQMMSLRTELPICIEEGGEIVLRGYIADKKKLLIGSEYLSLD